MAAHAFIAHRITLFYYTHKDCKALPPPDADFIKLAICAH